MRVGARVVLAVLAAALVAAAPARAAYEVGTAERSLNPTQAEIDSGEVYLGGYGATGSPPLGGRHATGVLGEGPKSKAFVVGDGKGGAVALATIEVQGWFAATRDGPYGLVDMRRAVEEATDGELLASEVFIQSNHSHSGADAMGVWGGVPLAYRKRMFDQTVAAIVAAWEQREPAAQLVYGTADGSDLLSNQFSYDPNNQSVDTDVRVLQARDGDGNPLTTLVNFSAHTTVLGSSNTKISGDWTQRLDPMLAQVTGGSAVTLVGTLGRTQPKDRGCSDPLATGDARSLCALDDYASKVKDKVAAALANAQPVAGDPVVHARSYLIQDVSSNPFLLGLLLVGPAAETPMNRAVTPPWMTGSVIGTVTGTARIGDVLVSSVPGEIYPQIAQEVRDRVGNRARGFMTMGLSNDQLGYIIAPFPGAYPMPICATLFEDCGDTLPVTPGALPNDNYFFNVSHTMGERVICSLLRGAEETLGIEGLRAGRTQCAAFANDGAFPAGGDVAPTDVSPLDNTSLTGSGEGPVKAGVGKVDATWRVGASAGQYASTKEEFDPNGEIDPSVMQLKNLPSYGVQSRLDARAVVLEGSDGKRYAVVKNDLYIPQDLLWRRTAQILEDRGTSGVTRETLTIAVTHNHSSPYYSSTGVGAWAFQDVFDVRFFEYYAQQMARAVEEGAANLHPARIGASVGSLDKPHRHSFGPAIADDGTPAGYPHSDAEHDLSVVRIDHADGRPLAMIVNYALHPEMLEGNDLISGDYIAPLQRMVDRETGAMMLFTQGSVGTAEPERSSFHDMHERLEFTHKDYAQAEFGARLIADEVIDTYEDVAAGTPEGAFAPLATSMPLRMADRWYPGPLSHPLPTVGNCRFDYPAVPGAGLPDCERVPLTTQDAGVSVETLQAAGIPVPENVSAPSYGALEEDVSVHMQALRIGEILLTMCSCEQWADQSRNIKTRTDKVRDNQYLGYSWAERCVPSGTEWSCVNPRNETERLIISDALYRKMRAQVHNDAVGWDFIDYVPFAESEPADPAEIKGNYTHEELAPANGYELTIPVGMTNDYNGYIATYREFQRGDHYRKALTAWGPHSSDYFATRLVQLAGHLKDATGYVLPTEPQRQLADALGQPKVEADMAFNDAKARSAGEAGSAGVQAYSATLPDDAGAAAPVTEPNDIERFGAALFTWNGGSNYTDNPDVRVQRRVAAEWVDYADQSGEVPVTVRFPRVDDGVPDYTQGSFEWHWTATFEAFVAPFDTGERGRATPPGDYRFVVDGLRRQGGAEVPYRVASRVFTVSPWRGITVEGFRLEPGNSMSFTIGPRRVVPIAGEPPLEDELGPVDYPDSYNDEGRARFIREQRTAFRDPRAPADPDKVEWYCFTCTFRPWIDVGDAQTAFVTITRADGTVEVVPAVYEDGRWRTDASLRPGDRAWVAVGGVQDPWGNHNGMASPEVSLPLPEPSPTPTATATETPSPTPTATPSPEPTATESPSPTATSEPSPTTTSEPSPTATSEPSPTTTSEPSPTATGTPSATASPTPMPTIGPPTPTDGRCGRVQRGTARGDFLRGTPRSDRLLGRGGNDRLLGEPGADCLVGGAGKDRLRGGAGSDILRGGRGNDRLAARGGKRGSVRDVVRCGPGRDVAKVDVRDRVRRCEVVRRS